MWSRQKREGATFLLNQYVCLVTDLYAKDKYEIHITVGIGNSVSLSCQRQSNATELMVFWLLNC